MCIHLSSGTTTAQRSRLPRAERREQILRSGAAAFRRTGFDGTSMDTVAVEAGVTRLIVYRIFESKELLYRAVLDGVLEGLVAAFSDQEALTARGGVAGVLLGVARQHPDGFRLLWRHAAHEPQFSGYAADFRQGVADYADRVLHPPIGDPALRRWAARTVTAYLYDGICAWLDDGNPEDDEAFVALLGNGSRALVNAWRAST